MLISSEKRSSSLYDTLNAMGMLSSEEKFIRTMRTDATNNIYFTEYAISYDDINRISYTNPHFMLIGKPSIEQYEIWVGDHYEHPDRLTWIQNTPEAYCVLSAEHDASLSVSVFYNPGILHRYHRVLPPNDTTLYQYKITIDLSKEPFNQLTNPDRCIYYITENAIKTPTVRWLDEFRIEVVAPYQSDIDLFICKNIISITPASANTGVYIDRPNSPKCYPRITVDHDWTYPIDARFYPCIKVDKDCVIRVFSDDAKDIPYPEVERLVLYPEFSHVDDPYNTSVEYLRTLNPIDDVIKQSDSPEVILKKFLRIARFCYRIWERFPKFSNEQSDFCVCDNTGFQDKAFVKTQISCMDGRYSGICSLVPVEDHRDILFYQGSMFTDYIVRNMSYSNGLMVENDLNGIPSYVILDDTYDPDQFTLVKFNAWENTHIENIGDYIDPKLTARFHATINRFYRNLLVVRQQILEPKPTDDHVRVTTVEPSIKDDHMWYELLVNVNPDMFEKQSNVVIDLYGLDANNIPDKVKTGAYRLDLNPEGGPDQYKDMLLTFEELTESQKKYLALHYGDGINPRVGVYHSIKSGNTSEPPDPKYMGLIIDDPESDSLHDESTIIIGTDEVPPDELGPYDENDLYVQSDISIDELLFGVTSDLPSPDDMTRSEKIQEIRSSLTDQPEDPDQQAQMIEKVLAADDVVLDRIIGGIRRVDAIYEQASAPDSDFSVLKSDAVDEATLKDAYQMNVKMILSNEIPADAHLNDMWVQLDGIFLPEYHADIVSHVLLESVGPPKNPYYDGKEATMYFEYGAYGDADGPEIFRPVTDQTLRKIHYGHTPPDESEMESDRDIWFEFIDDVMDKICYFDRETMVVHVNERLVAVKFAHDNMEAFLFDDVVLNFRGRLGIPYLTIAADLLNSGVIDQHDLLVFYHRLITVDDGFQADINRLYTGTSYVVSENDIDTVDLSIIYSTNLGRFTMDYSSPDTTNKEREAAYRMCIDYSGREFAYLADRMLVFVNGKYINRRNIMEDYRQCIQILDFHEIIKNVDIIYAKKDKDLMEMKRLAYAYWPNTDKADMIQRPKRDYSEMIPIDDTNRTYRGYYDVLMYDYILNGRLLRILRYLEEHPDERDGFIKNFIEQFHMISDLDLSQIGRNEGARIIIPALGDDPEITIGDSQ